MESTAHSSPLATKVHSLGYNRPRFIKILSTPQNLNLQATNKQNSPRYLISKFQTRKPNLIVTKDMMEMSSCISLLSNTKMKSNNSSFKNSSRLRE